MSTRYYYFGLAFLIWQRSGVSEEVSGKRLLVVSYSIGTGTVDWCFGEEEGQEDEMK